MMTAVLSNLTIYLAVAQEAAAESARHLEAGRIPKPDAQQGYIVTIDPARRSFKQGLIAIAFAGMYLDALLSLVGTARLGRDLYKKIDRQTTYEEKLALLGVREARILTDCKRFREARNDIIHEKALELDTLSVGELRRAQVEAKFAIVFIAEVRSLLEES